MERRFYIWLVLLILSIILAGLFSGLETAVMSADKVKISHYLKRRLPHSKWLKNFIFNTDRLISSLLLGTNFSIVLATISFTHLLLLYPQLPKFFVELITIFILTPFILVFGEVIPKIIFRLRASNLLIKLRWLLRLFYTILNPLNTLVIKASTLTLGIFGISLQPTTRAKLTPYEFQFILAESEEKGILHADEHDMIQGIVNIKKKWIKEIATPVKKIVAISARSTIKDAKIIAKKSHHLRFPIYNGKNFIGIINSIDILLEQENNKAITDFLKPLIFLEENISIYTALVLMRQQKIHLGIVRDEENHTIGLVTINDLLEEIVGEI
jgi:CBS domain containing-hemolysin-like protein